MSTDNNDDGRGSYADDGGVQKNNVTFIFQHNFYDFIKSTSMCCAHGRKKKKKKNFVGTTR